MVKMKNQNNSKELAFTESQTLRNEAIENTDADFLEKIKAIPYLTNDMVMSIDQIANYYECSKDTVSTIIKRNKDEFVKDGMIVLKGEELKEFKSKIIGSSSIEPNLKSIETSPSLTLLSKRSLLRVGLIMTNNAFATKIRNYLLNIEETASIEDKQKAIAREAGKIIRDQMESSIARFIPYSKNKKFAYPNYTNLIYKVIFGKDAKTLKAERNVKSSGLLRDYFTKEELKLVEEVEHVTSAFIIVGQTYNQIKEQLEITYKNRNFRIQG